MKFKRVWHPWTAWEEAAHNMWGDVADAKSALQAAIDFTGDHSLYGSYMVRVVREWPISCENALTDDTINRKAWVGHAAVALALQIPEDITRKAWGHLSGEQKFLANREAEKAISIWENDYIKAKGLYNDLGGTLLS